MLEIKRINPTTVLIIFNTKAEMLNYVERIFLISYYESINNKKKFNTKPTLDKLQVWYKKNISNKIPFTSESWAGFAITRDEIYSKNQIKDLNIKDEKILSLVNLTDTYFKNQNYCLLFVNKELNHIETAHHEIAHSLWYYNKKYKKEMYNLVNSINSKTKKRIFETLKENGYADNELVEETHAYLSTDPGILEQVHGVKKYNKIFKKAINKYFSKKKLKELLK